jgi:hypothetical protein
MLGAVSMALLGCGDATAPTDEGGNSQAADSESVGWLVAGGNWQKDGKDAASDQIEKLTFLGDLGNGTTSYIMEFGRGYSASGEDRTTFRTEAGTFVANKQYIQFTPNLDYTKVIETSEITRRKPAAPYSRKYHQSSHGCHMESGLIEHGCEYNILVLENPEWALRGPTTQ